METDAPTPQYSAPALNPKQSYEANKATIREMIQVDHFSNTVPDSIIDLWLQALDPTGNLALPPNVKGFYGGDLRASIPIELAHDCYKHVVHETTDRAKIDRHARRMLIALSLLDMDRLSARDANLAGLALWHKALAQARLPDPVDGLVETIRRYEEVRPRASLSDAKLPHPARLKARLLVAAEGLANEEAAAVLRGWEPETKETS